MTTMTIEPTLKEPVVKATKKARGVENLAGLDGETFGDRLRRIRIKHGHTQQSLEDAAKVSQNYISDLEGDKTKPSVEVAVKLALFFQCSLDYLVPRMGVNDPDYDPKEVGMPSTLESKMAVKLIDSLAEEERQNCLNLLRSLVGMVERRSRKNQVTMRGILRAIEIHGGPGLRKQAEREIGIGGID